MFFPNLFTQRGAFQGPEKQGLASELEVSAFRVSLGLRDEHCDLEEAGSAQEPRQHDICKSLLKFKSINFCVIHPWIVI